MGEVRYRGGWPVGLVLAVLWLGVSPAPAAEWVPTTGDLLRSLKPGFGGLCGVAVDHRTGDVYVDVSDQGVFRSADQGRSWQRVGQPLKGRTEWPGCLLLDPVGKGRRLVVATVYGGPVAVRPAGARDWTFMDNASSHVDWCAVDRTGPRMKLVLALKHESGGLLIASRDGGKSFKDVGKGFGPAWVFDGDTAVVAATKAGERARPALLRTTDGGKTFKPCGDYRAQALPKWHDGALYWVVDGALIRSADRGETWDKVSDLKDGRYGPLFGQDARHLFVLTANGIVASTDGGASWSKPIPLPPDLKPVGALTWIDYDPKNGLLYAMRMGSQLYKMARQ